jgi:glutamyl-tRNA synthetase
MNPGEIRVRFAPSPTGPLHIGGVRTALYNYLFARKQGGRMVLRIEDTDQARFVPGAEQYILESLAWCGITFDEGVHLGGPYAPYRQSERKEIYREHALKLIGLGHAYYAFDTPDELENMRKKLEEEKALYTSYNQHSRAWMKNSLTLTEGEVKARLSSGDPYVIRMKMPENEKIVIHDIIRGEVAVDTSTLDDKVLFKSDGMPTYHLANIVDDYLMKISHVIRGEEWLPSLPLHVLLYRSFGWEEAMPSFAHMPLTLKPDGKGKLSKRDGDRLGFPVFPLEWKNPETGEVSSGYRESGYFPEAFINILAFLGWNPGTEQELFTMDELIEAFSLERVGKSGSRFDPGKATWYNHQYLIKKSDHELAGQFMPVLKRRGISAPQDYVEKVVGLVKERVDFVKELWNEAAFFFVAPESYDAEMIRKKWKEDSPAMLGRVKDMLASAGDFTAAALEQGLRDFIAANSLNTGQVMSTLRLVTVGSGKGPGLVDILALLGKGEVLSRIERALDVIK